MHLSSMLQIDETKIHRTEKTNKSTIIFGNANSPMSTPIVNTESLELVDTENQWRYSNIE